MAQSKFLRVEIFERAFPVAPFLNRLGDEKQGKNCVITWQRVGGSKIGASEVCLPALFRGPNVDGALDFSPRLREN